MLALNDKYIKLVNKCEKELLNIFNDIDSNSFMFSKKVLDAFHKYQVTESDLNGTTGYGYNDEGRRTLLINAISWSKEPNATISLSALYLAYSIDLAFSTTLISIV